MTSHFTFVISTYYVIFVYFIKIVNTVVATMRECWHANPNARLPALRVKKTLSKLMKQNATDHSPQDKSLTTEQL